MAVPLAQSVLDALTDVAMPKPPAGRPSRETVRVEGVRLPLHRCEGLVLGSGAAGLRAAVEMKRRGVDVVVATQYVYGGTSACSGSDKQTLHTASDSGRGDDFDALADALGAGGAMDEDVAYVEAVGSPRALASLQFIGLPIPQDRLGGALRYQTDHDEAGRATSCGPRTSRLMVQGARRGGGAARRSRRQPHGWRARPRPRRSAAPRSRPRRDWCASAALADNPLGLVVFLCDGLVLAAGGPGELYRDSVYPKHCFGSLGLALEAGIEAVNLTESQFGIGTPRDGFPWNLSGTYAQAMPYIYLASTPTARSATSSPTITATPRSSPRTSSARAISGRSTRRACSTSAPASSTSRFSARRRRDGRCSWTSTATPRPCPATRRSRSTGSTGTCAPTFPTTTRCWRAPIERLRQMNPLSIELYKRYKYDITREPLEFAVNNQHMNGGVAVDIWGRTSLGGCYAVGEAAGTHGVTRPGGAALNAGQVFGLRCAEHIAASRGGLRGETPVAVIEAGVAAFLRGLGREGGIAPRDIERDVQARMSDYAGFVCTPEGVRDALAGARALNARIRAEGVRVARPSEAARAAQWRQMALASEAALTALDAYIGAGGGSRGARAILDPEGASTPQSRLGPLDDARFRAERAADRERRIVVRREGERFVCETRAIRRRHRVKPFFERDWPEFLSGAIYRGEGQ